MAKRPKTPRPSPAPATRAAGFNGFERTRRAHRTELAEDYLELIDELIQSEGRARSADIARRLGVSHVTVSRALGRLREAGLIVSPLRQPLELSPEGQAIARQSRRRHGVVREFLEHLGVPAIVAEADTEGIEHHCSRETIEAMRRWLEKPGG